MLSWYLRRGSRLGITSGWYGGPLGFVEKHVVNYSQLRLVMVNDMVNNMVNNMVEDMVEDMVDNDSKLLKIHHLRS